MLHCSDAAPCDVSVSNLKLEGAPGCTGASAATTDVYTVARGALALPMGLFKVLAFKKIRKACGLDRCELLYTGAAPLSAATADYLKSVDMPLLEVFGMSESCGAIAVSGPLDGARPRGACGRPRADVKLRSRARRDAAVESTRRASTLREHAARAGL